MRDGGTLERMRKWASKQFARCLKIASVLHLCEYSPVTGSEALNAVSIVIWCENHAIRAFGDYIKDMPEVNNAKYILNKLKRDGRESYKKRDVINYAAHFQPKKAADRPILYL